MFDRIYELILGTFFNIVSYIPVVLVVLMVVSFIICLFDEREKKEQEKREEWMRKGAEEYIAYLKSQGKEIR